MRNLVLGLATCFAFAGLAKADVVLASNTAGGTPPTTTGTGTLSNTSTGGSVNTNLTYTTVSQSNSGGVTSVNYSTATNGWSLNSSVGAFSPTTYNAFNIGVKVASATQSIQSSQTLSNFYLVFNYTQGGTYDFSSFLTSIGGSMTYLGGTATANTSTSVTVSNGNNVTDGFMVQFSGTMTGGNTYSFTTSGASADGSATLNIGVAVPEPGTLLLGGIAACSGAAGAWWKRRKRKATQPETTDQPATA